MAAQIASAGWPPFARRQKGHRNKAGGHQVAGVVEGGVCRGCAGVVACTGLGAPRAWSCRRGMGCAVPFPPMAFDHSLVQWKHRRLASVCECGFVAGTSGGAGDSTVVGSVTRQQSTQLLSRLTVFGNICSEEGHADGNPPISETWSRQLFKRMFKITHMKREDVALACKRRRRDRGFPARAGLS